MWPQDWMRGKRNRFGGVSRAVRRVASSGSLRGTTTSQPLRNTIERLIHDRAVGNTARRCTFREQWTVQLVVAVVVVVIRNVTTLLLLLIGNKSERKPYQFLVLRPP